MSKFRAPYLVRKRGIFYLQKRIPKQLTGHFGRTFVRKSLRTKDRLAALRLATSIYYMEPQPVWLMIVPSNPTHICFVKLLAAFTTMKLRKMLPSLKWKPILRESLQ